LDGSYHNYVTIEPEQTSAHAGIKIEWTETGQRLDTSGENLLMRGGAEGGIVLEGVAQVIDGLGNPLLALTDSRHGYLVSPCLYSSHWNPFCRVR
jgi:hypothetical protein